jgi:hypothetical protein
MANSRTPSTRIPTYTGQVVYIYSFDIAYELRRRPEGTLLGQPIVQASMGISKRSPRQLVFYRPNMINLPPEERIGPHGRVRIERAVKMLSVGAISITVRVPFSVKHIEELVSYHDLEFSDGSLFDDVRRLTEEVRQELLPYCNRPIEQIGEEEAYTVFCITSPLVTEDGTRLTAERWLEDRRREVASIITQEQDLSLLSDQEVDETTARGVSYYGHDLTVVDWDAALIINEPPDLEETLLIMELANVQLTELEAYDRILDDAVMRSYRDLEIARLRGRAPVMDALREIRIDLARLSDELSNITKFFGDWHLARIYQMLSERFHLGDWHRVVAGKLNTLDSLYGLHKQDQNNRWMLILEFTIVLLFVLDLVVLFMGRGK